MKETKIAWTDHTFNPWMGCTKVSEGCKNCYAETFTKNRMGLKLWGDGSGRQITKGPWKNVVAWGRDNSPGVLGPGLPRLVFTGSLMDWAEDRLDLIEPRRRMFEIIKSSPLHFQLLTKRPENIRWLLPDDWEDGYKNVWLGTTIENMKVSHRADILRDIPARIKFISYEPALGPLNELNISGIDWVIYGGESGSGYRPENKDWARDMLEKCRANGTAFFHKQSNGYKTEMGTELDGQVIKEFPKL